MSRHRKKKYVSKYTDQSVWVKDKRILKIEQQNAEVNDKFKTVFYVESKEKPEGRMCIAWGRTTFQEGDFVDMKGRFKDDVFLVWTLLYKRNAEGKINE